ncbi:MAG TPA: hypothetical protein VN028_08210, partial [Rhodocyclaceae bacterium]|nr:hypothetical protein [Rhodocyclaceae bacterium]
MSDSLLDRARRRLRRDYCKWRYANAVRKIVQTPPLSRGNLPFMLLSMVHTRDVLSYLVAVKSFARQANPESIVVVCDPTISDADRALLREQIPHIELRDAETFAHPGVPRGGCWERLQAIAHYSPHHYVVQLDADTVTTGPVDSVCAAIRSRAGFVLGEERGQRLLTLAESSARAAPLLAPNAHVQTHSEAALASIGLPQER